METRTCKVCGVEKPFERGTWVWKSRDGLCGNMCKACAAKRTVAYTKERLQNDPEFRQKANEAAKAYFHRVSATEEGRAKLNAGARKRSKKLYGTPDGRRRRIESSSQSIIKRRATPEGREAINKHTANWKLNNKAQVASAVKHRKLLKISRVPAWLTDDDKVQIAAKYAMAKWLSAVVGVDYHVDHVIPLKGRRVSGLYVPDNLCVLRATENLSKGNKWLP